MITPPEDELKDILKRIILLNSRLKDQLEELSKQPSNNKNEQSLQSNLDRTRNLYKMMEKDERPPPAYLKSLSVNYDGKGRWITSDPLVSETEKWAVVPSPKRSNNQDKCTYCKYKEGLEELLNILSVCGFIRKPEIDTPTASYKPMESSDESKNTQKDEQKKDPRDLRIKFKSQSGSEREFYY